MVKHKWPKNDSPIASKPTFLNGALHWLATKSYGSLEILIALDLAAEKFQMYKTLFTFVCGLSVFGMQSMCLCK